MSAKRARWRAGGRLVLAMALAAGLVGCGDGPTPTTTPVTGTVDAGDLYTRPDPTDPTLNPTVPAEVPGPLAQFNPNQDKDVDAYDRAYDGFITKCMKKEGFDYISMRTQMSGDQVDPYRQDDWWGIISVEAARDFGYHDPPRPATSADSQDGGVINVDDLPAGYAEALWGPELDAADPSGCAGQLDQLYRAGQVLTVDQMQALDTAVWDRKDALAKADPRIGQATAAWSTCMAKRGYTYADPTVSLAEFISIVHGQGGSLSRGPKTPAATDEEKRVALADAECKIETGFWDIWKTVNNDAETQVVEEYRPQLEQRRNDDLRALRNINDILVSLGEKDSSS